MKNKIFAISDIHGCYDELMALYKKLPIDPKVDQMVFLGDYIDRGPDSSKVVQQLLNWSKQYPHWVFLKGNHEDLLLDALNPEHPVYGDYYLWFRQGGTRTKSSYLPKGLGDYEQAIASMQDFLPPEHKEFMEKLPLFYETEDYIFVHGGIKPGKTPQETTEFDLLWLRDEFIHSQYDWGKKVIYGHTVDDHTGRAEPNVMENKIGIDTGAAYLPENRLTAIMLPEEEFYFQEAINL